jgi:hypothetical protein
MENEISCLNERETQHSYAVSVRRTSALPAASFRFHLAMDTLAVQLAVPLAGPA